MKSLIFSVALLVTTALASRLRIVRDEASTASGVWEAMAPAEVEALAHDARRLQQGATPPGTTLLVTGNPSQTGRINIGTNGATQTFSWYVVDATLPLTMTFRDYRTGCIIGTLGCSGNNYVWRFGATSALSAWSDPASGQSQCCTGNPCTCRTWNMRPGGNAVAVWNQQQAQGLGQNGAWYFLQVRCQNLLNNCGFDIRVIADVSPSNTPSNTPTSSGTPSNTPTRTQTPSGTPSPSGTSSQSPSNSGSDSNSPSPSVTPSQTPTGSPSSSKTPPVTITPSPTGSDSGTPSFTGTGTPSPSVTETSTSSVTEGATPSETGTQSTTPSLTPSASPTASETPSSTPSGTPSISVTPSVTPSSSITPSGSPSPSNTPSNTPPRTITPSRTPSNSPTPSHSATLSPAVNLISSSNLMALRVGDGGARTNTASCPAFTQTCISVCGCGLVFGACACGTTNQCTVNTEGCRVFLDVLDTSGALQQTLPITLPNSARCHLLWGAGRTREGFPTISDDGRHVSFPCYDGAVAPNSRKVVVRVASDLSISFVGLNDAYTGSGALLRTAVTAALGSKVYVAGNALASGCSSSASVRYLPFVAGTTQGTTNVVTGLGACGENTRMVGAYNGNLYATFSDANYAGLYQVGDSGFPTVDQGTPAMLPGFDNPALQGTNPSPWGFAFESPQRVYVADNTDVSVYHINAYTLATTLNVFGTYDWVRSSAIYLGQPVPAYSIQGRRENVGGGQPFILYAVLTPETDSSTIVRYDTAARSYTNIRTRSGNQVYRGVTFPPVFPSASSSNTPTSTQTASRTPTQTSSPSNTETGTASPSNTASQSGTPTTTPSNTGSASGTGSSSASSTNTGSAGATPSETATVTSSASWSNSASASNTASISSTASETPTGTPAVNFWTYSSILLLRVGDGSLAAASCPGQIAGAQGTCSSQCSGAQILGQCTGTTTYNCPSGCVRLGGTSTTCRYPTVINGCNTWLDEMSPGGALIRSTRITAPGRQCTLGWGSGLTKEGFATTSTDGRFVYVPCYEAAANTARSAVRRTLVRINTGAEMEATFLPASFGSVVSLASDGSSQMYLSASASQCDTANGVFSFAWGSAPTRSGTLGQCSLESRMLSVRPGGAYGSFGMLGAAGLYDISQDAAGLLPGFSSDQLRSPSPWGFTWQSDSILWVADDRSTSTAHLYRYTLAAAGGNWARDGSVRFSTSSPVFSIAGRTETEDGGAFIIYAVAAPESDSSQVWRYNAATGASAPIATLSGNRAYRAVVFPPVAPSSSPSRTPTSSVTPSRTPSASITASNTASSSSTASGTGSSSATSSVTPSTSLSSSASSTASITPSSSPSASITPPSTPSSSETPSTTPSGTASSSNTASSSGTPAPSSSSGATTTSTATESPTAAETTTPTETASPTSSPSTTSTPPPTSTSSPTGTSSSSSTHTSTVTGTPPVTPSRTETPPVSPSVAASPTRTASRTASPPPTTSQTPSTSSSATGTPSTSSSNTETPSASQTTSDSPSATQTNTGSGSVSASPSASGTASLSRTRTNSGTGTAAPTASPTALATRTPTPSPTATATKTRVPVVVSPTSTATRTRSRTATKTRTKTKTKSASKKRKAAL